MNECSINTSDRMINIYQTSIILTVVALILLQVKYSIEQDTFSSALLTISVAIIFVIENMMICYIFLKIGKSVNNSTI